MRSSTIVAVLCTIGALPWTQGLLVPARTPPGLARQHKNPALGVERVGSEGAAENDDSTTDLASVGLSAAAVTGSAVMAVHPDMDVATKAQIALAAATGANYLVTAEDMPAEVDGLRRTAMGLGMLGIKMRDQLASEPLPAVSPPPFPVANSMVGSFDPFQGIEFQASPAAQFSPELEHSHAVSVNQPLAVAGIDDHLYSQGSTSSAEFVPAPAQAAAPQPIMMPGKLVPSVLIGGGISIGGAAAILATLNIRQQAGLELSSSAVELSLRLSSEASTSSSEVVTVPAKIAPKQATVPGKLVRRVLVGAGIPIGGAAAMLKIRQRAGLELSSSAAGLNPTDEQLQPVEQAAFMADSSAEVEVASVEEQLQPVEQAVFMADSSAEVEVASVEEQLQPVEQDVFVAHNPPKAKLMSADDLLQLVDSGSVRAVRPSVRSETAKLAAPKADAGVALRLHSWGNARGLLRAGTVSKLAFVVSRFARALSAPLRLLQRLLQQRGIGTHAAVAL